MTVLYHYTSAHGLVGIIRNRKIWATESNYLNDPSEIAFGAGVVKTLLEATIRDASTDDPLLNILQETTDWISQTYLDPHSLKQFHEDRSFIASFSTSDDSLTTWRNYSGPHGFCIGFDKDLLASWLDEGYPALNSDEHVSASEHERFEGLQENYGLSHFFTPVSYGRKAADLVAEKALEQIMKSASSDVKDDYELRAELRALASVKHASFADEREVRLVIQRAGDLSPNPAVRISPSHGLVAYHEVAFPHDAIISITTAPGGNQARARHALRSLLSDGGRGAWSHVEIRSTDIPFNW